MSKISLIAALSENDRVIGRDNKLPWHVKSDLQNFKQLTLGKPVIMGRKTFVSLPGALVDRPNIVVTRDPFFQAPGATVFTSVEQALDFARDIPADEVMVIGGEQIFEATLDIANRMYLTIIQAVIQDGDAFFPAYDESEWDKVSEKRLETASNEPSANFIEYQRRTARAA